jgi:hypothetical protein
VSSGFESREPGLLEHVLIFILINLQERIRNNNPAIFISIYVCTTKYIFVFAAICFIPLCKQFSSAFEVDFSLNIIVVVSVNKKNRSNNLMSNDTNKEKGRTDYL